MTDLAVPRAEGRLAMDRRVLGSGAAVAAVVVVVSLAVAPLAGQGAPKASAKPGARAGAFVPARTPWGDPDISGSFTNKDEQGVPMERAPEFAGRQLVTDEEFASRIARAERQLETDNAEFDIATADTRN